MTTEQPLPSAEAIRAYLAASGWTGKPPGSASSAWERDGNEVAIPSGDAESWFLQDIIDIIAHAEGRAAADVVRDVMALAQVPAVPSPLVAAAFDRAAVRELVRLAIGKGWNQDDHPAAERVAEAVWPLLEHAQAALTDNEGVRLWMLDCGELVAKHRARAEAAEAKLAEVTAYIGEHKGDEGFSWLHALDILAITGTEEETRDG